MREAAELADDVAVLGGKIEVHPGRLDEIGRRDEDALGKQQDGEILVDDVLAVREGQKDEGLLDGIELRPLAALDQLPGDGAPGFSVADFVLEHFRRRDASASATDSSNRRIGADVAWHIAGFGGATLSYQIMFEDWRKQFADALRYDADHAVDFDTRWVLVEWQKTGVRSQEYSPRVTGFTNAGRAVGSPLGPDAEAVYAGGRRGLVIPWAEVVRLSNDTYKLITDGPILHETRGIAE